MGCLVVDDPERVVAGQQWLEACLEEAVNADEAQIATDYAGPSRFADSFGMRRENPLADRASREAVANVFEGLRGKALGLREGYSCRADRCDDARADFFERCQSGIAIKCRAQASQFFEQFVNCSSESSAKPGRLRDADRGLRLRDQ